MFPTLVWPVFTPYNATTKSHPRDGADFGELVTDTGHKFTCGGIRLLPRPEWFPLAVHELPVTHVYIMTLRTPSREIDLSAALDNVSVFVVHLAPLSFMVPRPAIGTGFRALGRQLDNLRPIPH